MAALPIQDSLSSTTSTIPTETSTNQDVLPKLQSQSKNGHSLDLKQSKSGSSSNIQPNVDPAGSMSMRLASSLAGDKKEVGRRVFKCLFCGMEFNTSQEFAGHHNGHRREIKDIENRLKSMVDTNTMDSGNSRSRLSYSDAYLRLSRHRPRHYRPYNRPLVRSQMPSTPDRLFSSGLTLAGIRSGNGGDMSLARLSATLDPPVARVGNPRVQRPIASRYDGLGATVRLGGGPPSTLMFNNGSSNAVGGGRISVRARFEGHQMELEPVEDLDLTLKL